MCTPALQRGCLRQPNLSGSHIPAPGSNIEYAEILQGHLPRHNFQHVLIATIILEFSFNKRTKLRSEAVSLLRFCLSHSSPGTMTIESTIILKVPLSQFRQFYLQLWFPSKALRCCFCMQASQPTDIFLAQPPIQFQLVTFSHLVSSFTCNSLTSNTLFFSCLV